MVIFTLNDLHHQVATVSTFRPIYTEQDGHHQDGLPFDCATYGNN